MKHALDGGIVEPHDLKVVHGRRCGEPTRLASERLQIMLTPDELVLIDDFRFKDRMPSRAAAVREILTRGLSAMGFAIPNQNFHSSEFGVTDDRHQDS
jgi:hypothetical protein